MNKNFFLKACLFLLLGILGTYSVQAQCVTFTHMDHKGFQNNVEEPYVNFTGLTYNYPAADGKNSDWLKDGNTVSYIGEISSDNTNPTTAIQRYNHGTWYGVLFDWFTLNYTAPAYTRIVYTLNYQMEIWRTRGEASIRAAYFDFGTDPNGYWANRENDPLGYSNFSTSCREDFGTGSYPYCSTRQGEDAGIWAHTGYVQQFVSPYHKIEVTVDNRNGNEEIQATRYGGFSSAKSNTNKDLALNHYTRLFMWYSCETYYYKQITYHANIPDADDQTQTQTLENQGVLFGADAFTYAGHHIVGWTTQADGGGDSYSPNAGLTINMGNKGAMDLYAVWAADEEATNLMITTAPAKTTYTEGERFDAAGMVVTATVGGESKAVVGYTIEPNGALTAGTTSVTIAYGGQSTTQAITVNAAPTHIVTFGENITVSPATTSGSQMAEGTELTFTAAERTGYEFVGFYSDNGFENKITSANPYSTTVANANITVYAKYMATTKTYTRENLTVDNMGTVCLGYASIATSGAKFYEINYYDGGSNLYLNEVTHLEAGRPYIFEAKEQTLTITYDGKAEVAPADHYNGLYGTYAGVSVTSDATNSYAAIKDNLVMVAIEGVTINIPMDRAYIFMNEVPREEQPHAAPLRCMSVPRQSPTGNSSLHHSINSSVKTIKDGQFVIVRDGKTYNAQGFEIH